MANNLAALVGVALATLVISYFRYTEGAVGMPRCAPCPEGFCPEPEDCDYGVVMNHCGRKVCAKGPGQECRNDMFKTSGICGPGLTCLCDRCIGCSLHTFECYQKTCV